MLKDCRDRCPLNFLEREEVLTHCDKLLEAMSWSFPVFRRSLRLNSYDERSVLEGL